MMVAALLLAGGSSASTEVQDANAVPQVVPAVVSPVVVSPVVVSPAAVSPAVVSPVTTTPNVLPIAVGSPDYSDSLPYCDDIVPGFKPNMTAPAVASNGTMPAMATLTPPPPAYAPPSADSKSQQATSQQNNGAIVGVSTGLAAIVGAVACLLS